MKPHRIRMQEFEQAVELANRQVVELVLRRAEEALEDGRKVQLVREFQSSPGEVLREFESRGEFERWKQDIL
ncbi:MAG: hypothetical protein V5A84_03675, partial [Planctomycetota bacterium]